ncbi:PREDICTED: geminin-like isoform X1 [Vollenhovia emeryi]|uniref:geminin-like isoform X1 n=1 Tax=Vollenhovia emeryi TaxID=411798 RepID=UPI0005F47A6D|nr:PREDICTED: geminin-like isoform X1 [Vollenhovia emeryi]
MEQPVKTVAPKTKDRKPLHILQPAATDNETLVGADRILRFAKSKETKTKTKQYAIENVEKDTAKCTKMTKISKAVQTAREEKAKIEVEDLTSDEPSENYWQIVAERRRMALVNAIEENEKLAQYIEKLEEENRVYKEMLDVTKTFVEVLQEQIEDDRSGINNSLGDSTL